MPKFRASFDAPGFADMYYGMVRSDVVPHIPKCGGTLIDIGGGYGAMAGFLKAKGFVDRAGVIDRVEPAQDEFGLDFRYVGDLEDAALVEQMLTKEGPASLILCLDVLEHLVDPWQMVRRLHQGLAPGGVIVASIPNVRNYSALLPLLFRNRWTLADGGILDRTHLRFFVRSSAVELMTGSGLVLEHVSGSPNSRRLVKWFRRLTFGLFNSFTDTQYVIRVRRSD